LYFAPNKGGDCCRTGDVGDVTWMGERRMHKGFCSENLKDRDGLEDLDIDGQVTLKFISK
jgi:hypothetical protein